MPSAEPRLTVAVPTYNRAHYVVDAVRGALGQSFGDIEVLVSDNASDDDTAAAVGSLSDPRLRFVRQPTNLGMIGNWNWLLSEARGSAFLLLSDDDLLAEGALEALVAALDATPDALLARASTEFIDQTGRSLGRRLVPDEAASPGRDVVVDFLRSRAAMPPCSLVFRTAALRALGGFREDRYRLAVDAHVWMTLALRGGRVANAPGAWCRYRVHTGSETSGANIDDWLRDLRLLAHDVLSDRADDDDLRRAFAEHRAGTVSELLRRGRPRPWRASVVRGLEREWWTRRDILLAGGAGRFALLGARLLLSTAFEDALKRLARRGGRSR